MPKRISNTQRTASIIDDPQLKVTLLGSLAAVVSKLPGSSPLVRFRTQKTASLFAYLCFHAGLPQRREILVERFWPESELEQGRMSLRTALTALRKDLGEALVTDKTTVMLIAQTDLHEFERATRRANLTALSDIEKVEQLRQAVEIYGGPLLPGFYDNWIFSERDRLAGLQRAALQSLTRWHDALRESSFAIDYARRATILDPLSEELRVELIRLLMKTGQSTEAARQLDDLERLLEEHLGSKPSAETQALVAERATSVYDRASAAPRSVTLPLARGRFRGRRDVLSALVMRLAGGKRDADGVRLLTLFGPGGIGKTRLAIEAVRRLAAHGLFGEMHFVSLAEARTLEHLWESLFTALELTRTATLVPLAQVVARLGQSGTCLLVLDNLEPLALEAGEVAGALLEVLPGLTILVTSRQRLGTAHEELIAVGALPEDEGVVLFVDRARSVVPNFNPSANELAQLRTLVARLEGFPLAIELAAAWSAALTPTEMLIQLDEGLLALPERTGGEERHSSLSAAIRWSVQLLNPELRQAFFSLSVFRGGWFPEAAAEVCGIGRDALASLRDRSLITAQVYGTQLRFEMHGSLRTFGRHALSPHEQANLTVHHRAYFLQQVEEAHLDRPRNKAWAAELAHLIPEEANLRGAREGASSLDLTRFAIALMPLWLHQGRFIEGDLACQEALQHATVGQVTYLPLRLAAAMIAYNRNQTAPAEEGLREVVAKGNGVLRTRALLSLAQLALFNQDDLVATRHWLAAVDPGAPPRFLAQAQFLEGTLALYTGEVTNAADLLARASTEAQAAEDLVLAAQALNNRGNALHQAGELAAARQSYEQALTLREAMGLRVEILRTRIGLANVMVASGALEEALILYQQASQDAAAIGDLHTESLALGNQAAVLQEQGKPVESLALARQSLRRKIPLGLSGSIALSLNNIGANLLSLGDPEGAAVLHGAASALRHQVGMTLGPAFLQQLEVEQEKVRQQLGEPAYTEHFANGTRLAESEAIALALSASPVTQLSR